MSNDPYDRLTIAEAVRHVAAAENNINAVIKQLCKDTGMRIEIDFVQSDFGPPFIVLTARAK